MGRDFYYDYFSLRDVDIPAWHAAFSWPVAREETHGLTVAFMAHWIELVEACDDPFVGDCALACVLIPKLYAQVINHYAAVSRLTRAGRTICHSPGLRLVPQFLHPDGPFSFPPARLPGPMGRGLAKGRFKNFLYSLWYNRAKFHKFQDALAPSRYVMAFHTENVLMRAHTHGRAEWVRVFAPWEWHGISAVAPAGAQAAFAALAGDYAAFAAAYARDVLDVPTPPALIGALAAFARESLADMARGYAGLLALFGRMQPRALLTPTAGNPFTRAVSLAARRHGVHVTGFPHGYYVCHSDSPRLAYHEMSTVDAFMAYTPGSVPLFQRNLANHTPARGNVVSIEHDDTTLFRDRFRAVADKPRPDRIRRVMVLELALIPEWAGYHCAESLVNFHFYYSLCRKLSDMGYDVVFKRRPKAPDWAGVNIFRGIPRLRVETRPFEAPGVLDAVDAVIIQYGMSSTLNWSMCSNKTVIFADAGWEPWYPDVYEKMAKRCRILPCAYDERGRATFRTEDLLKVMSCPPERPDTEYLESYLFPEGEN